MSRKRFLDLGCCAAVFAIAFARLAGLVAEHAVNVPYGDQWDSLRFLFEDQGPIAGFHQQHGPHRLGLASIINWYLYHLTGWDVRAESWACVIVLGISAWVAVHLSARIRGELSWRDGALLLLLLGPVTWETMILTPFLAHSILPLLLLLLLARAWMTASHPIGLTSIGLLSGIELFTGFGFSAAVASVALGLLIFIKPGRIVSNRWQLMWPLGAFCAFALWFAWDYRWNPAAPGWRFPVANWWDYPRFMAFMFASLLGMRSLSLLPMIVGTAMLATSLAVWAHTTTRIWKGSAQSRDLAIWLFVSTSLFYAAFTAIGRLPVSIEAAFLWRYTSLMMPAVIALFLAAEERLGKPGGPLFSHGCIALVTICIITIWSNFQPERNAAAIGQAKRLWVAAYLASNDLPSANKASRFNVEWYDPASPKLAARLDWLKAHRLSLFRETATPPPSP